MGQTIGLSDLPKILREMTGRPVSYQVLYRRIVDGALPAEKSPSGRWLISADDLPAYVASVTAKRRGL
jgi:hypothetical protein